ncbi:MAG: hypothetical protein LBT18_01750 [Endomicrobium sp.]|nr:hypothetical protein [Endomicrobium sp.]
MSRFGFTTSIFVGTYLGKNQASIAQTSIKTSLHVTSLYIFLNVLAYIFIPNIFMYPFSKGAESAIIEQIRPTIIVLLRFGALFLVFESLAIIFSSAIKGAGDTAFAMKLLITLFIFTTTLLYLATTVFKMGLYSCWSILIIYGIVLAVSFYLRYKTNKWKYMRVIKMEIIDR